MKCIFLLLAIAVAVTPSPGQNVNPPRVVEPAVTEPRTDPVRDPDRRAVFVVGDSTVKNHGPGEGWGTISRRSSFSSFDA